MMNADKLSEEEVVPVLKLMVASLDDFDIPPGGAVRFHRAGEWELCFRELFYAAKTSKGYAEKWRWELQSFNNFFSKNPYASKHMGFPLS